MIKKTCMTISVILVNLLTPAVATAHNISKQNCMQYAYNNGSNASWNISEPHFHPGRYRRCMQWARKHNLQHICNRRITPAATTVKHTPADSHQRRNIARSIQVGLKMRVSLKEMISMLMAITAESSARNLPYGHSSSVGILQLLDTHGSFQWRMRIENSVGWYFRGVRQLNTRYMTPGQIADAVERPRRRGGYNRWQQESTLTAKKYLGASIQCLA